MAGKTTHGRHATGHRKSTHHAGHKMSAAGKARLSASLKAAAARRKAAGIKIHRAPMSAAQRAAFGARMKAAAASRKAAGIKIHRKPMSAAQKAKLRARFEAYLHSAKGKADRRKAMQKRLANPVYRAKLRARAKAQWARMDPTKKRKIVLYLLMRNR